MEYRTLGRTGLKVSEVGFGAWAIGGPSTLGDVQIGWGEVNDATSLRAVEAALDAGVTFFDTADVYGMGHSEELLGKAFKGRRDDVVIASKVGNRVVDGEWLKDFSPEHIRTAIDDSLRRLQTDYVDVYQLHSPGADVTYSDDVVAALEDIKQQGKVRFYGVSLTRPGGDISPTEQGLAILKADGRCDLFQVVYNMLERDIEEKLLPACHCHEVGVIARVPLASGFLTGKFERDVAFPENDHRHDKYPPEKARATVETVEKLRFLQRDDRTMAQAALQYVLSNDAVSTVIPGAKTPEQARDNAAASDGTLLTDEELARVRAIV